MAGILVLLLGVICQIAFAVMILNIDEHELSIKHFLACGGIAIAALLVGTGVIAFVFC